MAACARDIAAEGRNAGGPKRTTTKIAASSEPVGDGCNHDVLAEPDHKITHVACPGSALHPVLNRIEWRLYLGNSRRHMIAVVPDAEWPGMWRIVRPDGLLSDMTSISRAKDAAVVICQRIWPDANDSRKFRWKREVAA
jgi:hypothetical protein